MAFPEDVYEKHLSTINGVKFTRREIDVIACLVNARGTSKIASFLSVAMRTVMSHLRHIMGKIKGNSREDIIDFVEKSQKLSFFRMYYAQLVIESAFKKALKEVARFGRLESPHRLLITGEDQALKEILLRSLKPHLAHAGLEFDIQETGEEDSSSLLFTLCLMPNNPDTPCDAATLDLSDCQNYYEAIFDILKILLVNPQLPNIIKNFWEQAKGLQDLSEGGPEKASEVISEAHSLSQEKPRSLKRRLLHVLSLFAALLIGIALFKGGEFVFSQLSPKSTLNDRQAIRSDLIIPGQTSFLQRSTLISQMDRKLNAQRGIQTLALIGMGGAGKTTLARHYATEQKAHVVWEINAETSDTLRASFSQLASALAQTDEDQKILRMIREIRSIDERAMKKLSFVKTRLSRIQNWLLIYDNVENIADIKMWFPHDKATWGEGKVILTTRNSHIKNHNHVQAHLVVADLSPQEKLDLFSRIAHEGDGSSLDSQHKEKIHQFLKSVPSFPLDVAVAAHYIKNFQSSYEEYAENLKKQTNDFDAIQKNLLQEVGDYTDTRYRMISLSLEQLIKHNKEFRDLLFLISLLDSQNIPKALLHTYKNEAIANTFITYLKKHSLVVDNARLTAATRGLSLHRSTHSVCLHFLLQKMDKATSTKLLQDIVSALESHIEQYISTEDLPALKVLAIHCEAFLEHNELLSVPLRGRLKAELSRIYGSLFYTPKQKKLLHEALIDLESMGKKKDPFYARALSYFGIFLWESGELEEAQLTLKKSLKNYQIISAADDTRITRALLALGAAHLYTGHAKMALQVTQKVFEHLPSHHREVAFAFDLLGTIYCYMGDWAQSEIFFKKGLMLCRRYNSKECSREALILNGLGNLYRCREFYDVALQYQKQSLTICQKKFPPKSRISAMVFRSLARTYISMRAFDEGLRYAQKSIDILAPLFGLNNSKTQMAYYELAKSYYGLRNLTKAKEILEKCFAFHQQYVSTQSYQVGCGETFISLGLLNLDEDNFKKGEKLIEDGIKILKKRDGIRFVLPLLEEAAEIYAKKHALWKKEGQQTRALNAKARAVAYLKQALNIVNPHASEMKRPIERIQHKLTQLEKSH